MSLFSWNIKLIEYLWSKRRTGVRRGMPVEFWRSATRGSQLKKGDIAVATHSFSNDVTRLRNYLFGVRVKTIRAGVDISYWSRHEQIEVQWTLRFCESKLSYTSPTHPQYHSSSTVFIVKDMPGRGFRPEERVLVKWHRTLSHNLEVRSLIPTASVKDWSFVFYSFETFHDC